MDGQRAGMVVTRKINLPLPEKGGPKIGEGMAGFMLRQGMREMAQAVSLQPTQVQAQSYWDAVYAHDFRRTQARDQQQQLGRDR